MLSGAAFQAERSISRATELWVEVPLTFLQRA